MQTIDVKRLAQMLRQAEIDLIDVRMPTEFREVHAECARNVPLESLDPTAVMSARNGSAGQPLYVICRGGNRSNQACRKFRDAGFENVVNVEGGTLAWAEAGLPVVRGKKAVPLMQQVQVSAGFMTVLGIVLGTWVHPYGYGLSAFVGAGLMFAGLTGLCPLASFIAKMPWNKCEGGGSCPA
ncbi:MAG: rhodanese-like domain-containing protein [Planctomycetaceae bacterium]